MNSSCNLIFVFLCFSFVIYLTKAADVCVKKSACVCEFSNGTGIDISTSNESTFYAAQTYEIKKEGAQILLTTYYFHPCVDILFKSNTTINNTCTDPLSVCRHVDTYEKLGNGSELFKKETTSYDFMGKTSVSQFSAEGDSIIYANGPSSTVVLLVCAETDGVLQIYSLVEPNKIVLTFYSKSACLKQIDSGRSVGSTLLIIFFSCIIFYLVLGICTKKFLMGATGIEVIPNLGFWSDLPNLVKDGWAFLVSGLRLPTRAAAPAASPDRNSYDSI